MEDILGLWVPMVGSWADKMDTAQAMQGAVRMFGASGDTSLSTQNEGLAPTLIQASFLIVTHTFAASLEFSGEPTQGIPMQA